LDDEGFTREADVIAHLGPALQAGTAEIAREVSPSASGIEKP
jgi:hypothetical protein